jgi:hypothetical protein
MIIQILTSLLMCTTGFSQGLTVKPPPLKVKEVVSKSDTVIFGKVVSTEEKKDTKATPVLKYKVYKIEVIDVIKGKTTGAFFEYTNIISGGPAGTSMLHPDLSKDKYGVFFFNLGNLNTLAVFPETKNWDTK